MVVKPDSTYVERSALHNLHLFIMRAVAGFVGVDFVTVFKLLVVLVEFFGLFVGLFLLRSGGKWSKIFNITAIYNHFGGLRGV